jgi:glycosyltransferase involved in cell wall biosynthesis
MREKLTHLNIIAFTGGHNAPSRIPRVQSYILGLKDLGIAMTEAESRPGLYPPSIRWKRPAWGVWNLIDRIPAVIRSHQYDAVFFQREMLSTFVTLERFTKQPRILDIDDAIWVYRGGHFARKLAGICDHIICGNHFVAEQFSSWNPSVSVLPTPVDTDRFVPEKYTRDSRRVIGWLGLSSGFRFLYRIEPALLEVLRRYPDVVLRIVSNERPHLPTLPPSQLEYVHYQREREVAEVQSMTIGIMPLDDSVSARGKCSFKMLQYMACGIPSVVSPIGMNAEVLRAGNVGLGAVSKNEWIEGLSLLLENPDMGLRMGQCAREVVNQHYSVKALLPRLAQILISVVQPSATEPARSDRHMYSES